MADSALDGLSEGSSDRIALLELALRGRQNARGGALTIQEMEGIVGAAGGNREAWSFAADFATRSGNYALARHALERGLERTDGDVELVLTLGVLDATIGDFDASVDRFDEAIDLIETTGLGQHTIALAFNTAVSLYRQHGRYDLAREFAERAINFSDVSDEFLLELAELDLSQGDYVMGRRHVDDYLDSASDDAPGILLLSEYELYNDALRLYDQHRARIDSGGNTEIINSLGPWIRQNQGIDAWLRIAEELEDRTSLTVSLIEVSATLHARGGQLADAARTIERLPETDRTRTRILDLVGLYALLGADGRRDSTAEELTQNADGAYAQLYEIPSTELDRIYIPLGNEADLTALYEEVGGYGVGQRPACDGLADSARPGRRGPRWCDRSLS